MPNQRSATHAMSPTAQSESQLMGVLFQVRDEYVQAHNLVLGDPVTRLLRFLRIQRPPNYAKLAFLLSVQLEVLDDRMPGLARLTASPLKLKGAGEYFERLRGAINALHVLLQESSARNRLSSASGAMRQYRIAAAAFGTAGDLLRTQPAPDSRSASPLSADPSPGPSASPATTSHQSPHPAAAAMSVDERQPIATSLDLAGRLFDVATVGMRDYGKPLLEQSGVDDEVFGRLELEGLFLRLFTARTAFIREADQDAQLQTEVLSYFDDLVALHFEDGPQRVQSYADRIKAYQLVLATGDALEETLGREYSRLCAWNGEKAVAMGASQAIGMIVTAQEAVSDYRSNPLRYLIAQEK